MRRVVSMAVCELLSHFLDNTYLEKPSGLPLYAYHPKNWADVFHAT